jgi:hypothetical protein
VEKRQRWFAQCASKWISILHISAIRTVLKRHGECINLSISQGRSKPRRKIRVLNGQDPLDLESSPKGEKYLNISQKLTIISPPFPKRSNNPNFKIKSKSKARRRL